MFLCWTATIFGFLVHLRLVTCNDYINIYLQKSEYRMNPLITSQGTMAHREKVTANIRTLCILVMIFLWTICSLLCPTRLYFLLDELHCYNNLTHDCDFKSSLAGNSCYCKARICLISSVSQRSLKIGFSQASSL